MSWRHQQKQLFPQAFGGCTYPRLYGSGPGFTLLEVVVSIFLTSIFMGVLAIWMHRTMEFVAITSERTRHCQEVRTLCEILTTDCGKLFLQSGREAMELGLPSEEGAAFSSLTFLKRVSAGWERSLFAERGEGYNTVCVVRYGFDPGVGVIYRDLWGITERLAYGLASSPVPLLRTLPKHAPSHTRNLAKNVSYFRLSPLDAVGRKQARWVRDSSVGLECSITFRTSYRRMPLTFHARIPVPRWAREKRIPEPAP